MTPNMKLSIFMELKQRRLRRFSRKKGITIPEYYNKADAKSILAWPEDKALHIWDTLRISKLSQLLAQSCPYCHFHSTSEEGPECSDCSYGVNHGICGDNSSDWNTVTRTRVDRSLSLKWYNRVIQYINYMESKENG